MQVVVYGMVVKEKDIPCIQSLFDALHEEGIVSFVYGPYLDQLRGKIAFRREVGVFEDYRDFSVKQLDYVITLGGMVPFCLPCCIFATAGYPSWGLILAGWVFWPVLKSEELERPFDC
jgi:NAD+ kinase